MDKDTAIQRIVELVTQLSPEANAAKLEFFATKLVLDVLDFCNRDDFPEALIYSVAGALAKQFDSAADSATVGGDAPIKKITMDDTSFEFAVADTSTTSSDFGAAAFDLLKPRLNIYRKVKAL